ncbi:hypothetical protein DPEC_G00374890 [Dallia pectoralis]|nr:hypothetical protein DPEC_G00374890 [Dallia pectoralis]
MNKVVREARWPGEKYLSVDRNGASWHRTRAWYEVLKQAAQTLPKLFPCPNTAKGSVTQKGLSESGQALGEDMSLGTAWHELTLQEMICLTSGKPLTEPARVREETRPCAAVDYRSKCYGCSAREPHTAQAQCTRDDLESYVILKWCPLVLADVRRTVGCAS